MAAPKKKKAPFMKRVKSKLKKKVQGVIKYFGYKWILPAVFRRNAKKPLDEKLVVFADMRDREMPKDFGPIYELCKANGFQCVVLSGRSFGKNVPPRIRRKEKAKYHLNFIKLYARCRAVFLVEYFPPAYIVRPRTGTDVIQLWHACGVMKKIGYSSVKTKWGSSEKELKRYPMHNSYSLVCASSPRSVETFIDAFRCDPKVVKPVGCPRTDIYYDEKFALTAKKHILKLFPEIGERKIILYAPTFRGKNMASSFIDLQMDFDRLKECLGDEYALVLKFHPMMAKNPLQESGRIRAHNFLFDATRLISTEEALCAADILISDYSTIFFEYLLLERPIISYIYDIDTYIKDRGLYFPYDQLAPGPYVFTQEELIDTIQHIDEKFDPERTKRFRYEFMSGCDGHSTQRIYDYVFQPEQYRAMYEEETR